MTVEKIFELGLIDDNTTVWIHADFHVLARGNWYQDDILAHSHREIASFVWRNSGNLHILLGEYRARFWEDKEECSQCFESLEEAQEFYDGRNGLAEIQKWNPDKQEYEAVVFPTFEV